MTELAFARPMSQDFSTMVSAMPLTGAGPQIEMLPNPDFSFPRLSSHTQDSTSLHPPTGNGRPKSAHMTNDRLRNTENTHRRGASMLPNFSFNVHDASGLSAQQPESMQTSPARSGHRRNNSEFVGGIGATAVRTSSPTRASSPLLVPERKSHHKGHTRSRVTLSSNELHKAITLPEPQVRLSSSLPSTPLEHPADQTDDTSGTPVATDPAVSAATEALERPPSRPRVGFSDNVEYIPRPLSTISSETESSMSTVRGHSVNNSISSVLSLSASSPTWPRTRATSLGTTLEDELSSRAKSSLDMNKRVEREGRWLKGASSRESMTRPYTEPAIQARDIDTPPNAPAQKLRTPHKKRQSIGHALGFDRRKSEPAIGMHTTEPTRLSALSLQESAPSEQSSIDENTVSIDRRSSSRKLKDWAVSKITRKAREIARIPSEPQLAPATVQAPEASPVNEPANAETDLDAVFSLDAGDISPSSGGAKTYFEFVTPSSAQHTVESSADHGTVLDLDAALGPFNTPSINTRARRELHSSRGTRDFFGPGLHYQPNPMHRRTESAPMLTPFEQPRGSTPPQEAMADVFEEEEEHEEEHSTATRPASARSAQEDEGSMGVKIVDSDTAGSQPVLGPSFDEGLRIRQGEWELERPSTGYGNVTSRLSTPMLDRRASSVIEDTIFEESSPVEPAIVEAHEEPRAHSFTKSSDSSETPTLLAADRGMGLLELPHSQQSLTTPESYQSSAFSSPEFRGRQSSFETSRVGTSTSSITDNRTMSSCTTAEQTQDMRVSVDDVPSLTSSRSTMLSTVHANSSRREVGGLRSPSVASTGLDPATIASERRRKRSSIQSLSQLVGSPFGPKSGGGDGPRPQTAHDSLAASSGPKQKKEHRLKKLMGALWKSKHRQQTSTSTVS